jgi:hypothetical protein
MSNFIKGYQLRELLVGTQVLKPAFSNNQTASAGGTAALYTVTGGAVLVTSLVGQVATAFGTNVTTMSLGIAPGTGTTVNTGIAGGAAVTSLEAGAWVGVSSSAGTGTTVVSGGKGGNAIFGNYPFVVGAGTITTVTNNNNSGAINWYLSYVPLDTGASVS